MDETTPTNPKIPTLVRDWRTEHNLSLRQAADLLGVSHMAVAHLENGRAGGTPSNDNLKRWLGDERRAVRVLAYELFFARYSDVVYPMLAIER